MADSPFGAYRGGYQAMPQGWLQAAMQPGMNYAEGIQGLASGVVSGIEKYAANKAQEEAIGGSLPSQFSMYEQTAQAIGQPIDPTLAERYSQMGQMSLPQMQSFSKDLGAAQQQSIALANIQRQQQAFQMQQQAAQRAMQNRAQMEQLAARREAALRATGVYASPMTMAQPSAPQPTYSPTPPAIDPYSLQPQGIPGMTINPRIR